jgi:hypothetical protein
VIRDALAPSDVFATYKNTWARDAFPALQVASDKIATATVAVGQRRGIVPVDLTQAAIPLKYFLDPSHLDATGEKLKAEFMVPVVRKAISQ